MFGIFKKKETQPAPDPAAEKQAARIKERMQVAELQSKIAELRRQSAGMGLEIEKNLKDRAVLIDQISKVPEAQKIALARRVQNIDKRVAGLNASMALVEQQIGNNEAVIRQLGNIDIVNIGDVGKVVDMDKHREKIAEATTTKLEGDTNVQVAEDMTSTLVGDVASQDGDPALAAILEEAKGTFAAPAAADPLAAILEEARQAPAAGTPQPARMS